MRDGKPYFLDWAEACVSHPFVGSVLMLRDATERAGLEPGSAGRRAAARPLPGAVHRLRAATRAARGLRARVPPGHDLPGAHLAPDPRPAAGGGGRGARRTRSRAGSGSSAGWRTARLPLGEHEGRLRAEPRPRPVPGGVGAPALAGGGRLAGRDPRHDRPAPAPAGRHARPAHRRRGAPHPGRRRGRRGRDRPRRQVDLPRPGTARLLPDPRPAPARPGRQALLPRARGGADPDARPLRRRGRADRRADRRLAAPGRRGRSRRSGSTSRSG